MMQAALIASLAASAVAAPLVNRRQAAAPPMGVNDAVILNYALSLEHLEATFYREALAKFSDEDFKKAGLGADFVNNLKEIAKDEATHVDFLTTGLQQAGAVPAQECKYKFGYTDVQSFLATANLLEGVGVSAYLGAAQYIASADYLTAAGAILTVESRHSAYIRDNQTPKPLSPFPAPFDIPQSFNNVFSLAAPLIESCPDGTAGTLGLPFKAYPSIAVTPAGVAKPGDTLTFTVSEKVEAAKAYFITFPGGAIEATIATADGITYQVTVPEQAQPGQAYVVFTSDEKAPSDDNTVAGPAVFEILDNAGEFQKANPDYSYGKDCDKDYEHKPEGYGKVDEHKSEGYPSKDAPHYQYEESKPYSDEKHDDKDSYAPKKDDDKSEEYPKKDDKSEEYPKKDDKSEEYPKKDDKSEEYPKKDDKSEEYPEHKEEHEHKEEPEHKEKHEHKEEPEYNDEPAPYESKKDEVKHDAYPAEPEHKDEPKQDKEGHVYPVNKDGKVSVYDEEHKPYPLDKNGKPYYHDKKENKYYTIDAYGKHEPCDKSYHPY